MMARAEQRIPAILKSMDALKRLVAKAVLVDTVELETSQKTCNIIGSNIEFERMLLHADTGPIVMEAYTRQGLHPVPMVAYNESGYQEKIEGERT